MILMVISSPTPISGTDQRTRSPDGASIPWTSSPRPPSARLGGEQPTQVMLVVRVPSSPTPAVTKGWPLRETTNAFIVGSFQALRNLLENRPARRPPGR